MKKLIFTVLVSPLIAYAQSGFKISQYPAVNNLKPHYQLLLGEPGVSNYNIRIDKLYQNIATNIPSASATNWSEFPATQNVEMYGWGLTNLGVILPEEGGTVQIIGIDAFGSFTGNGGGLTNLNVSAATLIDGGGIRMAMTNQIAWINVMDFIAPGSGGDLTATRIGIQKALDYTTNTVDYTYATANSTQSHSVVYFPNGRYYLDNVPLYIRVHGTKLMGEGGYGRARLLRGDTTSTNMFEMKPWVGWNVGGSTRMWNTTFENLELTSVYTGTSARHAAFAFTNGLGSQSFSRVIIRNCEVNGWYRGIYAEHVVGMLVDRTDLTGNNYGADLRGCDSVSFRNCFLSRGYSGTTWSETNETISVLITNAWDTTVGGGGTTKFSFSVNFDTCEFGDARKVLKVASELCSVSIVGSSIELDNLAIGTNYGPAFDLVLFDSFSYQGRIGNANAYPATQPLFKFGSGMGARSKINSSSLLGNGYPEIELTSAGDYIHYFGSSITVTNTGEQSSYEAPRVTPGTPSIVSLATNKANPLYVTKQFKDRYLTNQFSRVSVRDFGATGNGSTDDHAAIQAAIYYAATNSAEVYFAPGRYRITDTLSIPASGASSLTNRQALVADGWASTMIDASDLDDRPAIASPGAATQQGHFKMQGLYLLGPVADDVSGGVDPKYANLAAFPYVGSAGVVIGDPTTYAGGGLASFETLIEECRIEYFEFGIKATNAQTFRLYSSWVQRNGKGNVVFSHVDSALVQNGHYGTLLVTNRAEDVYNFFIIGTPNSTWGAGHLYYGGADSGVHKMFVNLEMNEPFIYADGAMFTVFGGQFEIALTPNTPITNGWCKLTNVGQYNFIGSRINLPGNNHLTESTTNSVIWNCLGSASAGLFVHGCSIGTQLDATLTSTRPTWFRIVGDPDNNVFYSPYWNSGGDGPTVGTSQRTFMNCLWIPDGGSPTYRYVPPNRMGSVQNIGTLETGPTITNAVYYGNARYLTNNPLNRAVFFRDDFAAGTTTSGQFGELGWATSFSSGALVQGNPDANHPWWWTLTSGSTSNSTAYIRLINRMGGYGFLPSKPYEAYFVFKLTQTNDCDAFVGLAYDTSTHEHNQYGGRYAQAGYSVGVFYTNGTHFFYKANPSSGVNIAATGVGADTGWHTLCIRGNGSSQTYLSLDGGAETLIGAGGGGTAIQPTFCVTSGGGASKSIEIDFFAFQSYPTR